MRVAIDARPAVARAKTGVGWYAWHLIRRLPDVDPQNTYLAWYLYFRRLLGNPLFFRDVGARNFIERWTPFPARLFWRLSRREFPPLEWLLRFDVLFATNFVPPPTGSRRVAITVHDLAFRRTPDSVPAPTRVWLDRQLGPTLGRAAEVLVPSDNTREDLLDLYDVAPDRVTVTPLGVDHSVYRPAVPEAVDAAKRRHGIDGPYLLYVGGIEPRKNVGTLVRAFERLGDERTVRLAIAGAAVSWDRESAADLRRAVESLEPAIRERVILTGYLGEREKAALLSGAEAFVYPSLYEGFGLPVAEAMACGAPVLTSRVSAIPETAGDAAVYVDPRDVESVTDGLRRLLEGDGLRRRLREAGLARATRFTWTQTARLTAEVLRRAAAA